MSRTIRNFSDMLGLLARGKFKDKLNEEMAHTIEVLENLPSEKGSAKITVEITLNYQGGRLDIKPAVKTKLPESAGFQDTPFWTYEGGLSVQHPSQMDLLTREVRNPRDDFDDAAQA